MPGPGLPGDTPEFWDASPPGVRHAARGLGRQPEPPGVSSRLRAAAFPPHPVPPRMFGDHGEGHQTLRGS